MMAYFKISSHLICLVLAKFVATCFAAPSFIEFYQKPGVNSSDVIRAHGYYSENYEFVTDDGYVLGITRGRNPFINDGKSGLPHKDPILFIHGTLTEANSFIVNSFGIKPRDLSHIDLNSLSQEEAIKMLGEEPSAKSLPMLAMNFGHEIWLLHRRGAQLSRRRVEPRRPPPSPYEKLVYARSRSKSARPGADHGHKAKRSLAETPASKMKGTRLTEIDNVQIESPPKLLDLNKTSGASKLIPALTNAPLALLDYFRLFDDIKLTIDSKFWNFSLDEQAAYDVPNSVDFIRKKTGRDKVIMLGDSSGGALVLMSLILNPGLNDKVSKAVAWAPSFNLGHADNAKSFIWAMPLLSYIGPYPWPFLTYPLQAIMEVACGLELMQKTLCEMSGNANWGPSKGQSPMRSEYFSNYFVPVSTKEIVQLLQFASKGYAHLFDFGTGSANMRAYGQITPPRYDPGLISCGQVSIWASSTDRMVSPKDTELILKSMKVPHKLFVIDQPGVSFNHGAYLYHKDVARLAVIPTLKDIASIEN